jgi:hypothetical protein
VLTAVPNEALAAMIVAALGHEGIMAHAQGSLTSGFRAEAPGNVQVLVRRADLDRARALLESIESA